MLESELHDLSDDADYAASQQQGSASVMLRSDSTKQSSSPSERDGDEIVFLKDNVAIHPTQTPISGRLMLIKQGSSLFMTWIPSKGHNSETWLSDKETFIPSGRCPSLTSGPSGDIILLLGGSISLLLNRQDLLILHYTSIVEESKSSLLQ